MKDTSAEDILLWYTFGPCCFVKIKKKKLLAHFSILTNLESPRSKLLFLGLPPPSLCCLQLRYQVALPPSATVESQGAGIGVCKQGRSVSHPLLAYGKYTCISGLLAVHVCMGALQLCISLTHSPPSATGSLGLW